MRFSHQVTPLPAVPLLSRKCLMDHIDADSSRFWDKEKYVVGGPQESFDKQDLRNWLTENELAGKEDVTIPEKVVLETVEKYQQIYEILTGTKWEG